VAQSHPQLEQIVAADVLAISPTGIPAAITRFVRVAEPMGRNRCPNTRNITKDADHVQFVFAATRAAHLATWL
jgi:hypothetical protein